MKTCTKCKVELPESNFYKESRVPDGLRSECKDCCKAHNTAYAAGHREQIKEYLKQYWAANKEQFNEQQGLYRATHKEQIKAYKAVFYKAHREQIGKERKQYLAAHREQNSKYHKQYRVENLDAKQKTDALWRKNNPEVMRIHSQTRRARKAGLASTLTLEQWTRILNEFNNTCAYCGVGDKKLHQEHFVPVLSSGEYGINNIIPACKSCNSSKGAKDFFVWYPKYDFYDKAREKVILDFLN